MTAVLNVGDMLDGKYAIRRVLGEGGMGIVYEAHHTRLDQLVAIKVMLPEMLSQQTLVARFEREARAAAKLKSRHAARVFDVDTTPEGLPYIVMELLHGRDLADVLACERQMPVGQAVHVILQVCCAIHEAHEAGIVHRDLKPANVFLASEGDRVVAKVLDFGISKELQANTRLTNESGVVGTVLYMSPEQVRNEPLDHRTDIWSLGAVLYEALAGAPPFDGPLTKVAAAIVSEEPPSLRDLRPDLPKGLRGVVRKMLAKAPSDRFATVLDVMYALAPFSPSQSVDTYLAELERKPSHPNLTTTDSIADTIDAIDAVKAPRVATEAGLSAERLAPVTETQRRKWATIALASLAPLGIGAAAVMFGVTRAPEPTGVGAPMSAERQLPQASPSSEVVVTPPPPSAAVTAPELVTTSEPDAGKSVPATSGRAKKRTHQQQQPSAAPANSAPASSTRPPSNAAPLHL